jgi:hypothetical protein
MPSAKLRIFPRGFLGGDIAPQVERTPKAFGEEVDRHQYQVNEHNTAKTAITANPHVEALYAGYIKRLPNSGSFEYRKEILLAALSAFGTPNFRAWYFVQHDSPAAGDLHNRFLTDTLKFLSEGRREMSLETWASLLTITDEGNNIGGVSDYAVKFFEYGNNDKLTDVIQLWCEKSGGLEDLLGTLHILFGNP